jgi:hypothetical protein
MKQYKTFHNRSNESGEDYRYVLIVILEKDV